MKRYKLLKDTPTIKAGTIFEERISDFDKLKELVRITPVGTKTVPQWTIQDINSFDEWFEKIEESTDSIHWKPKSGEEAFCLNTEGDTYSFTFNNDVLSHCKRFKIGNIYRTEEDTKHANELKIARTKIRRSSNFKPNWDDADQIKWHVVYDHVNCCLDIRVSYMVSEGAIVYYETREDTRQAIKDLEPEYLLHFGVEKGN